MKSPARVAFRRAVSAPLAASVLLVGPLLLAGCASDESPEVVFLQRVRAEFPDVSVNRATDDRLLRLGQTSCGPEGLATADDEELRQIGIDRPQFVAIATELCPAR
jgi:hypothetical protein